MPDLTQLGRNGRIGLLLVGLSAVALGSAMLGGDPLEAATGAVGGLGSGIAGAGGGALGFLGGIWAWIAGFLETLFIAIPLGIVAWIGANLGLIGVAIAGLLAVGSGSLPAILIVIGVGLFAAADPVNERFDFLGDDLAFAMEVVGTALIGTTIGLIVVGVAL